MGLLIDKADFIGKFKIAQNAFTDIDSFIARYEERYLIEVLGYSLAQLFIADVNVSTKLPVTAKYLALYEEIHIEDHCVPINGYGMKSMLLGFLYFEYKREEKYKSTQSGTTTSTSETAREVGFDELNITGRYNDAVTDAQAIQWYIWQNEDTYGKRTFEGAKYITPF